MENKKKLGNMHWLFALAITKAISVTAQTPIFHLSNADIPVKSLFIGTMAVIAFYRIFLNYIFLLFTSKRYMQNVPYVILCAIRAIAAPIMDYRDIANTIAEYNANTYYFKVDVSAVPMLVIELVLSCLIFGIFAHRREKERIAAENAATMPKDKVYWE